MPNDRHPADQAVTLPRKQRISICILDEAVVGTLSDGQHGLIIMSPSDGEPVGVIAGRGVQMLGDVVGCRRRGDPRTFVPSVGANELARLRTPPIEVVILGLRVPGQ